MKKKKRAVWVWVVLLLVVAAVVAGYFYLRGIAAANLQPNYSTTTVTRGTVTRTITGSGRLETGDSEAVEAESTVEIAEILVTRGDRVQAGDVLATYDTDAINDRIKELSDTLSSYDQQLMRRTTRETVNAPTRGRVKEIYAAVGDSLDDVMQNYGSLLLLSADEKMFVDIETAEELAIGKTVTVVYENGRANGTVANVTADGYRITLTDNNVPNGGSAEVFLNDTKLGTGTLQIHAPISVYATNGTISEINVKVNDTVSANGKLFTLAEAPASTTYADAVQAREDAAEELQKAWALRNNPVIAAPADGIVAEINAQKDSKAGSNAFVLHTGGAVKMTVSVDELDIGIVSVGQVAAVTLDAFSGETFSASVSHISLLGTASGSITTYAVELTLDYDERFLEGMNGSAVIVAQQKDDVLLIPVAAIHEDETGIYVYVQTGEDAARREIETGLSDGTKAEITAGLSEGDVIRYQESSYIGVVDQFNQYGMMGGRGGN